jgi:class 3 adenylate cyclase
VTDIPANETNATAAAQVLALDCSAQALKRRYYLLMASVFVVDAVMTTIFAVLADAYVVILRNLFTSFVFYVVFSLGLAHFLFRRIAAYLDTGHDFAAIERNLTQLPLRSAIRVGALSLPLMAFRIFIPFFLPPEEFPVPLPTILDAAATTAVLVIFYFVYTYFLITDYLASLGVFMFRRWGVNLGVYFGSFSLKLYVALGMTSVLPMLLVLVDAYSYSGDRVRTEIAVDAVSSLFGIVISIVFVSRSLNRPVDILSEGLVKVAGGDYAMRLPVTSNDEMGKLTAEFNRMTGGLQEREFIRETFGKYVSESVASQILKDRGRLSGEVRTATLVFIDIGGFTTMSEKLAPQQVIALLNDYTHLVIRAITSHGGVINNFIGDGVFASFNLPVDNEDHARNAVLAAIDISNTIAGHTFPEGAKISTRIGINTGMVVAGTVGSGERLTYSILGDAVNLAHRVEELNKEFGSRILVTDTTYRLAGDGFPAQSLGPVAIRGKSEPVIVHRIDP